MSKDGDDLDDDLDEPVDSEDSSELENSPVLRSPTDPKARRRVEEKQEELRLRRMTMDFDFD